MLISHLFTLLHKGFERKDLVEIYKKIQSKDWFFITNYS